MKTTLEIPDLLFRKAKSTAAERGQTLKQLVTEALQEKLAVNTDSARPGEPGWMQGFGKLRRLRKEVIELRRANEILKAASAFFAQEIDPTRRKS